MQVIRSVPQFLVLISMHQDVCPGYQYHQCWLWQMADILPICQLAQAWTPTNNVRLWAPRVCHDSLVQKISTSRRTWLHCRLLVWPTSTFRRLLTNSVASTEIRCTVWLGSLLITVSSSFHFDCCPVHIRESQKCQRGPDRLLSSPVSPLTVPSSVSPCRRPRGRPL